MEKQDESPGIHTISGLGTAEERKTQRRSRIRVKLEEARQREMGIRPKTPQEDHSDPEKDRVSSKQIAKSKERLKKLITDGKQLVSGVIIAGDSREVTRRMEEDEFKKARYEKMDAEANASAERFEEIMKKWSQADSKRVPQELKTILDQQRQACKEMKEEKDRLINEFEEELKSKDAIYVNHLKQQAEDIDLLVERMEEQAHSLVHAFHEELRQIEESFAVERRSLVESEKEALDKTCKDRSLKEEEYLETREKRMEENEAKIQHLRIQNAEEFNQVKIKLETDIQHLQQQIQQMKATFQLNGEKLEYNYQVLKKRDEENVVTISQQKRKLTRLQDVLNNLRGKLAKQEKTNKDECENLMAEYQKNIEQYKDLQKKVRHFQLADINRFYKIWKMNEEKARELAQSVADADQIIHEQQLGLAWTPPESVPCELPPLLMQMNKETSQAMMYVSQVLSESDTTSEQLPGSGNESTTSFVKKGMKLSHSLIKETLEVIAEEGSFLIESKILQLLAPLEKDERMLMKLDSMFKALRIQTEAEVEELVGSLVEETECPTVNEDGESVPVEEQAVYLKPPHPNKVTQGLKLMVKTLKTKEGSSSATKLTSVFGLQNNDTTNQLLEGNFWNKMASILPTEHKKLWDALQTGLEKYHSILLGRSKLLDETNSLRQQNGELRLLLQQYMHSQVNRELEMPPTLMMPGMMDYTTGY